MLPLKRAGTSFKALCPFHSEKSPSFTVNPQRQTFHCFGCGKGGSVFKFLMEFENLSFLDSVHRLAERAGIPIIEEALSPEDDARHSLRKRLLSLHAATADWFHQQLRRTAAAEVARAYLKERGISSEIAARWKIGYAPDAWDAFLRWAGSQGYKREEIIHSGLVTQKEEANIYDRFRGRLMFPIHNDRGEVIAFSGRILTADARAGKYVNSPETPLFSKGSVLFGLDKSKRAIHEAETAVVCEGQLDTITAYEAGVTNVLAPQGTAFTPRQAQLLRRHTPSVILCYDADGAGEKAAERAFEALFAEGLIVRVAAMPPGEDPDSLIRKQGVDAFRNILSDAKEYFDYLIDHRSQMHDLTALQGRMSFARTLAPSVALVGDAFLRDAIINKVSDRLQLGQNHFRPMVERLVRKSGGGPAVPAEVARREELARPGLAVSQLTVTVLQDAETRAFLLEQPWQILLPQIPDSHILQVVLSGAFDPARPESVNSFLATLPEEEEAMIRSLQTAEIPVAPAAGKDCWLTLQRSALEHHIEALASRLRQPGLDIGEALKINKEILDLDKELKHIARLS